MLRTGGLHSPYESLTLRFDARVSPYVGRLLSGRGWCAVFRVQWPIRELSPWASACLP